jgi:hypothetical protein
VAHFCSMCGPEVLLDEDHPGSARVRCRARPDRRAEAIEAGFAEQSSRFKDEGSVIYKQV